MSSNLPIIERKNHFCDCHYGDVYNVIDMPRAIIFKRTYHISMKGNTMRLERDTGAPHLLSVLEGGVLVLTLNRPEARNAMTDGMLEALRGELSFAESSPAVRCVVLRGAGTAFCAGGDVKAMETVSESRPIIDERIQWQRSLQRDTAGKLFKMPKPTLAVINGPAAGAGLALALSCDLRLMASSAILVTAFASVGLSGDFGATYFLSRLVGAAKAREMMFLSERMPAAEALRLGLVNWCCDPEHLQDQADTLAARLASGPSTAFGYMKENLNRAINGEVDECMDLEATHHIHCGSTADHLEGVAAFAERRIPKFGTEQR